jgi:hypothetical protein
MPVRIQMLSANSAAAPRGGLLIGLILGLLVLIVLALVMLPVLLVIGGLGVVTFGILRVSRWIRSLGQTREAVAVSGGEDFDALRARLESRTSSKTSVSDTSDQSSDHAASQDQIDEVGRRNVRVVGAQS